MPTALLVTADLGGNIPPIMGIAGELVRRGWTVHLLGDERLRERAGAAGLRFLRSAIHFDPLRPMSTPRTLITMSRFFGGPATGREAVEVARRVRADVVLVDTLLVGAVAACTTAGMPTVVLGHTLWTYMEKGFARGPIALLMRVRGLDMMKTLASAHLMLIPTSQRLDDAVLPRNALRIGPVLQETPRREGREALPRVLVSLSTNWFPGQDQVLQRVLDAVAPLPVEVTATAGRAIDLATLRVPANAQVHRMLDHAGVLPGVDLLIGHGGHATTVRALAHGVPVLVIPLHAMIDQRAIGQSVERAGAGLVLPTRADPAAIRTAAQRLLGEPSFRARAEELGAEIRSQDAAAAGAAAIERVAADGRVSRVP